MGTVYVTRYLTNRNYIDKPYIQVTTTDTPSQCKKCGKDFEEISFLLRHISSNTYEKPYQCSHCDKCFSAVSPGYNL